MIEEPPILRIYRNFRRPTAAQVDAFRGVPTGFVCDAMEGNGSLATAIAPINPAAAYAVGVALVAENGPAEILATLAALNLIQKGDIVVGSVQGHQACAGAGDLVLGMMKNAGAAGFVTDGPMRDIDGIEQVGLPAWCTGLNPASPYGKGPGTVGGGATVGGRQVNSGDIIIADRNGVVVVPFARIDEVIANLSKVKAAEADVDAKVKNGMATMLDIDAMVAEGRAIYLD